MTFDTCHLYKKGQTCKNAQVQFIYVACVYGKGGGGWVAVFINGTSLKDSLRLPLPWVGGIFGPHRQDKQQFTPRSSNELCLCSVVAIAYIKPEESADGRSKCANVDVYVYLRILNNIPFSLLIKAMLPDSKTSDFLFYQNKAISIRSRSGKSFFTM